jgi:putative restriction endonuclease
VARTSPVKWTREHYLVALNLYSKLRFGQFDGRNPTIIEVAKKLGRSPGSLSMKLCNLASLDPVHQARGVGGLPNVSAMDVEMWNEFQKDMGNVGTTGEEILHNLFTKDEDKELDFLEGEGIRLVAPTGPTERTTTVKVRRGQQFFRQAILNAYNIKCCISGINVPRLLVASHIKPWGKFPADRLNPRNGLCLSSIHDAAFDNGLIAINENLEVMLSNRLRKYFPQPTLEQNFAVFEGKKIQMPDKLAEPDMDFLRYHRDSIFQK